MGDDYMDGGLFIALVAFCGGIGLFYLMIKIATDRGNANKDKNKTILNTFRYNKSFKAKLKEIAISEDKKQIALLNTCELSNIAPMVLDVDKIIECTLIKDDIEVKSSGIGRAVVGGILAGGAGAVVGASTAKTAKKCDKIELKFKMKDLENPIVRIITHKGDSDWKESYEACEDFVAYLELLRA